MTITGQILPIDLDIEALRRRFAWLWHSITYAMSNRPTRFRGKLRRLFATYHRHWVNLVPALVDCGGADFGLDRPAEAEEILELASLYK